MSYSIYAYFETGRENDDHQTHLWRNEVGT